MSCGHQVVGIANGHSIHAGPTKGPEFLSIYRNLEDVMHEWVVCARYLKEFRFGLVQFSAEFVGTFLNP